MSSTEGIVVIAHRDEPWRGQLFLALQEKGYEPRLTQDGSEALKVLIGEAMSPVAAVVLGYDLEGTGSMDVLYKLKQRMDAINKSRPTWPVETLLVITDAKDDEPFLSLLTDRGVNGFVYPEANVHDVVAQLSGRVYAGRRTATRYRTQMNSTVQLPDKELKGELVDLSANGGLVIVDGEVALTLGVTVGLILSQPDMTSPIHCEAIVRNVRPQKKLFSNKTALGLQFSSMTPASRNQLDELLSLIQRQTQNQMPAYVNTRFF